MKKESLNQDIIEIPLILIKNPEILYEYNGKKTNFDVLKETLSCNGDCASSQNTCPDAQAAACYLINQQAVDP